jgi:septum formation protein
MSSAPSIVLASTSPYRRELLERLGLPFEVLPPRVDEAALPGETPRATALRLACMKAEAVSRERPQAVVIGSDQVADLDGEPLGKPLSHARAVEQLTRMQGRMVVFHTALALAAPGWPLQSDVVPTIVRMRVLSPAAIEHYLAREPAYDCAGSAKIEKLGIALAEAVDSSDPTALVGLPLIRLISMLAAAGVDVLGDRAR